MVGAWGLAICLLWMIVGGDVSGQVSSRIPSGYVQVSKEMPLVPGTRLRIYQSFKWNDLSVLGINKDGSIHVRFIGKPESWDNDFKRSSLIISQEDLDVLNEGGPGEDAAGNDPVVKNPDAQKPDAQKPNAKNKEKMVRESAFGEKASGGDGGKTSVFQAESKEPEEPILTTGTLSQISRDEEVVVGIPVRAKHNNILNDATVVAILDRDTYRVQWDSPKIPPSEVKRSDVYVVPKVLKALRQPGGKDLFASRADRVIGNVRSYPYPTTKFGIRLPLPKETLKVTEQTPLRPGAKVGLNNYDSVRRQDRWWEATVVGLNWDDSVRIHIDGQERVFDGDIARECLVISAQELSRLDVIAREEALIAEQTNEEWENLVVVTDEMQLCRGTPVYAEMADGPQDATVLDIIGDRLHVVSDATGGNGTEELSRDQVKIRVKVLEALKLPGTEAKLQRRAQRIIEKSADFPFPTSDFLPPPELPRGGIRVGDATPLEVGQRLKLFRDAQWWDLEITDLNWDGSVRIRVITRQGQFVGDIERRCLVMDKTHLAALEKSTRAEKSPFLGLAKSSGESKSEFGSKETEPAKEMKSEPADQGAGGDKDDPSSGEFKVVLKSFGKSKKIGLAQQVSDLSGEPFGDCLRILGSLPVEVMKGVSKREAEEGVRKLRAAGGEAEAVSE